ncbi:MAG: GNAT family N-acetyltransferase [Sphingopyxis sp.]
MDVRQIVIGDAPSVQAIYAPYVTDTTVSFEEVPPDIMEVERRIAAILPRYPYLVAEEDGRVVGTLTPPSTGPARHTGHQSM